MESKKIRVAVLYGGRSGEHEISLLSATNVMQYLDRSRFEVVPIGIDKKGVWYLGDELIKKELTAAQPLKLDQAIDRMLFKPDALGTALQPSTPGNLISKSKGERIFDVVFPVIHGTLCEDGTVQGFLELADVPYVGCGVLSSAVGMDKDVSKRLIQNAGLNVAPFKVIRRGEWDKNQKSCCEKIIAELNLPLFIKPANTGSSVGVHKVKTLAELIPAIEDAFSYDTKVVIEKALTVRELEVAVLQSRESDQDPIASVVGEVKPSHEFYSYAAKYLDEKGAELLIPAPISGELQEKVRDFAKKIFATLECEGMARVDLFLEQHTNDIYFNEVNTIPGFTKISMYPKLMEATGMSYTDLLTHLIMLALDRHKNKNNLRREYNQNK